MRNKPYTTPVWWLSIVLLIKLALSFLILGAFNRVANLSGKNTGSYILSFIWKDATAWGGFAIMVLIEVVIYWRVRFLKLNKKLVWGHLWSWTTVFIIIPILNLLVKPWILTYYPRSEFSVRVNAILQILYVTMWGALIIGHLCFAMALADVYKSRKEMANRSRDKSPDSPDGDWVEELHNLID